MSWQPPEQPVQLGFDDELAGGTATWYEYVPPGWPLPAHGDWVWGPEASDEDGEPVGPKTCYQVVRRVWTFVQHGSPNAQEGKWKPIVRVHVRKVPHPD